jgi:aminoglycoside/choline kinase family phosphotransferase
MPNRLALLNAWLREIFGTAPYTLKAASRDASFRRYFRIEVGAASYIVMDAPPAQENCQSFVSIAAVLAGVGVHVPSVLSADVKQGFVLLEDLGSTHYLDVLNSANVERLYGDAFAALATFQACAPTNTLQSYSETLLRAEMELFLDWFLMKHLQIHPSENERDQLFELFDVLCRAAIEQPQVFVHRDYHSRNLMIQQRNNPGILDFQDAVRGPVTYDLVSLLRDVYIGWSSHQVGKWIVGYHELALQHGILEEENPAAFRRWFDLMGVQRHLKVAGIFSRLNYRDGKSQYLKDITLTLSYLSKVCTRYLELKPLSDLFQAWSLNARLQERNAAVLLGSKAQ